MKRRRSRDYRRGGIPDNLKQTGGGTFDLVAGSNEQIELHHVRVDYGGAGGVNHKLTLHDGTTTITMLDLTANAYFFQFPPDLFIPADGWLKYEIPVHAANDYQLSITRHPLG